MFWVKTEKWNCHFAGKTSHPRIPTIVASESKSNETFLPGARHSSTFVGLSFAKPTRCQHIWILNSPRSSNRLHSLYLQPTDFDSVGFVMFHVLPAWLQAFHSTREALIQPCQSKPIHIIPHGLRACGTQCQLGLKEWLTSDCDI